MLEQKETSKNKIKILALIGKAGSGKDFVRKKLLEEIPNASRIISTTTRPRRQNEVLTDYHFIELEEFLRLLLSGEMLEVTEFNTWLYGTTFSDLKKDRINIGVFNPESIEMLLSNGAIELKTILLTCNDKERLLRQLYRENKPNVDEIIRRYNADKKDFQYIDCHDYEIANDQDIELTIKNIISQLKAIDWIK